MPSIPETLIVCLTKTPSNHPHLLFRLVTVPNSLPLVPKISPISSFSSVGNGPSPTRVVYAFVIPKTKFIELGPHPDPVAAEAATVFDDVTYGYVP